MAPETKRTPSPGGFEGFRHEMWLHAELFGELVHGESGRVRCDLEEYAARLTEVDRVKIRSVNYRRYVEPQLHQPFAPSLLLVIVRRPPRDMMNRANADFPTEEITWDEEVHSGSVDSYESS